MVYCSRLSLGLKPNYVPFFLVAAKLKPIPNSANRLVGSGVVGGSSDATPSKVPSNPVITVFEAYSIPPLG